MKRLDRPPPESPSRSHLPHKGRLRANSNASPIIQLPALAVNAVDPRPTVIFIPNFAEGSLCRKTAQTLNHSS